MRTLRMVWFVLMERLLRALPHPRWRAQLLRLLGAQVGPGVRVHPCRFMNHELGFGNLEIAEGVYIGPDCLLDLAGHLRIGARTTVSARSVLLTHADPGASQGNWLITHFPPVKRGCAIGADSWIGVGSILLQGADVGARSVVGAGSIVIGTLPANQVCVGHPARPVRLLE